MPLRLELGPEAAIVALDVRTREVLALVGSYEGASGALDRATQAHRQPGSTFKPFVYSYALYSRRFTPATMLETSPSSLTGYRPEQLRGQRRAVAPMRLREALAHSVNVAAVHVLQDVGPANVVTWAHALGIESKLGADLSLALGSYEVTPLEMAAAYATFAAGGMYEAPVLVTRITGPDGADIALPPRPPPRRVMDEAEAYVTTSLLTSVVDHGTGAAARSLGRPVAGKTGTSNQAKDTWFVGYSTGHRVRHVDRLRRRASARRARARRDRRASGVDRVHASRAREAPATEFPRPPGVVTLRIDPKTRLFAPTKAKRTRSTRSFSQGTEPARDFGARRGRAEDAGALGASEEAGAALAELPSDLPARPSSRRRRRPRRQPPPSAGTADGGLPQLPRRRPTAVLIPRRLDRDHARRGVNARSPRPMPAPSRMISG